MAIVRLILVPSLTGIRVWVDGSEVVPVVTENENVVNTTVDLVEIEFEAEVTIPGQVISVKAKT